MNIIETKNIIKKYGDFVANNDINISVEQGKILAIVGENGAGKTTLMNMLYGLLNQQVEHYLLKVKELVSILL